MDRELNHKLKKMLCRQLEGYSEIQNVGGKALEDIANMVKTVKNLEIIEGMAEEKQNGNSWRSYGSYEDGVSTRRGRDAMGRYTSRDEDASMRGASYHDGSHEVKQAIEEIKRKLDSMM